MRIETVPRGPGTNVVIGTRTYLGDDYIHVDIDPRPLTDGNGVLHPVDVVCDARDIDLPDGYADLVYTSECLEHFLWKETASIVKEWARILKPGGVIVTEVPDFCAAAAQLLATETLENHLAMQQIFFAEQLNEFDIHYAGISHLTLPYFYDLAGVKTVDVKRGSDWGWLRVEGIKK